MGGAAAAPYGAAASMKEPQSDIAFAGNFVECAVSLVDLPRTRDHAGVFVRIGVAEHDLLVPVPGFQKRSISFAGPKLAHDGGRVLKVFDGLEEGNGLEAGIGILTVGPGRCGLDANPSEAGKPKKRKHIFAPVGSANDILPHGF